MLFDSGGFDVLRELVWETALQQTVLQQTALRFAGQSVADGPGQPPPCARWPKPCCGRTPAA